MQWASPTISTLILSRSPYFRNMLHGPWKEASPPQMPLSCSLFAISSRFPKSKLQCMPQLLSVPFMEFIILAGSRLQNPIPKKKNLEFSELFGVPRRPPQRG
ncbi:hypothetical protein ACFX13_025091 [Malus domestica]